MSQFPLPPQPRVPTPPPLPRPATPIEQLGYVAAHYRPRPRSNSRSYLVGFSIVAAVFAAIAMFAGIWSLSQSVSSPRSPPPPASFAPPGSIRLPAPSSPERMYEVALSAPELSRAYLANEVKADQEYRGKRLSVEGVVVRVGKDLFGEPFVELGAGGFYTVHCYFDKSDEGKLAELNPKDAVIIEGTGAGMAVASPVLKKCKLQ